MERPANRSSLIPRSTAIAIALAILPSIAIAVAVILSWDFYDIMIALSYPLIAGGFLGAWVTVMHLLMPQYSGGIRGVLTVGTLRGLAVSLVALAVLFALPWVNAMIDADYAFSMFGLAIALTAAIVAGRQARPGWATIVAVGTMIGCVWAAAIGFYEVHAAGWEDNSLEELRGDDGDGIAFLAIAAYAGTLIGAIAGLTLGPLSQLGKRRHPV